MSADASGAPSRGGAAPMLPYGRQDVTGADVEAVLAVLRSPWLTQGPEVARFERTLAALCTARHAVAVNSATSALHLACLALDVGPGDWVWTTPNTFVASANCARHCGADVDFVDIDPLTYNLCPRALADKLHRARAGHQPLPKVVIPVHFAGQPCDMDAIAALADEYGFRLVEDASHAIGATLGGTPVGACRASDVTVFSFHPVKIVTSAEGGVATTSCDAIAERMRALRTHGVTRAAGEADALEPWVYEQHALGWNYRMSDVQAALGTSQLERLEAYVSHRHALADRYDALLADLDVTRPRRVEGSRSALHLYPILVGHGTDGLVRREVFVALRAVGIGVNVHYIPVHTQPYYRERGHRRDALANAASYYARTISLPLFGSMSVAEQDRVVVALEAALAPHAAPSRRAA